MLDTESRGSISMLNVEPRYSNTLTGRYCQTFPFCCNLARSYDSRLVPWSVRRPSRRRPQLAVHCLHPPRPSMARIKVAEYRERAELSRPAVNRAPLDDTTTRSRKAEKSGRRIRNGQMLHRVMDPKTHLNGCQK